MARFIIRDKSDGVLISLKKLLERVQLPSSNYYCLRNIELHVGRPLGLDPDEFEKRTREDDGFVLDGAMFAEFVKSNIQIIDGEIEIERPSSPDHVVVECADASQWEIYTESESIISKLAQMGFVNESSEDFS